METCTRGRFQLNVDCLPARYKQAKYQGHTLIRAQLSFDLRHFVCNCCCRALLEPAMYQDSGDSGGQDAACDPSGHRPKQREDERSVAGVGEALREGSRPKPSGLDAPADEVRAGREDSRGSETMQEDADTRRDPRVESRVRHQHAQTPLQPHEELPIVRLGIVALAGPTPCSAPSSLAVHGSEPARIAPGLPGLCGAEQAERRRARSDPATAMATREPAEKSAAAAAAATTKATTATATRAAAVRGTCICGAWQGRVASRMCICGARPQMWRVALAWQGLDGTRGAVEVVGMAYVACVARGTCCTWHVLHVLIRLERCSVAPAVQRCTAPTGLHVRRRDGYRKGYPRQPRCPYPLQPRYRYPRQPLPL